MGTKFLSPESLEVDPCDLGRWERGSWGLPLHMGSQVLISEYDMDVYMATLSGGEACHDLCWELGRAEELTCVMKL